MPIHTKHTDKYFMYLLITISRCNPFLCCCIDDPDNNVYVGLPLLFFALMCDCTHFIGIVLAHANVIK